MYLCFWITVSIYFLFIVLWLNKDRGSVIWCDQWRILSPVAIILFSISEKRVQDITNDVIDYCCSNQISDPVEILRKFQKEIVTGRSLDIDDVTQNEEGDTNLIFISREDILSTGFDEIKSIQDLRKTLEVQFYDEVSTRSLCNGILMPILRLKSASKIEIYTLQLMYMYKLPQIFVCPTLQRCLRSSWLLFCQSVCPSICPLCLDHKWDTLHGNNRL